MIYIMNLNSNQYYVDNYPNAYKEGYDAPDEECPYPYPKRSYDIVEIGEKALAFRLGQCDRIVADLIGDKLVAQGTGHRHSRFSEVGLVPKRKTYDENQKFYGNCILRTRALVDYLLFIGVRVFISGGAIGFDTWFAECINKIMQQKGMYMANVKGKSYSIQTSEIVHIVAVPCAHQDTKWPPKAKARYKAILEEATFVYYCDKREYTKECMQIRNVWMANMATYTAACFMMSSYRGGTYNNMYYALEKGNTIVGFDPQTWKSFISSSKDFYLKGYVPSFEYIEDGYYRERKGNIFDGDGQLKMNTTNAKGPMGKGIAAAFRDAYKSEHLEANYKKYCKSVGMRPGNVMYQTMHNGVIIANCCVKDDWRDASDIRWIESCLIELVEQITLRELTSVDLCWPGRANGWISNYEETVVPLMRKYFAPLANNLKCKITVWSLNNSK